MPRSRIIPLGRPDLDPCIKIAFTWIVHPLIAILYLLRLWIQRHRTRSLAKTLSDILSGMAWLTSAGGSIGITYEYTQLDRWDHSRPQVPKDHPYMKSGVHKLHFLYTMSYFVIIWAIKASFIAMYFDIFPTHQIQKRSLRWTMYAVAMLTGVTFAAMILAHTLYCRPIYTLWTVGANNCQPFRSRTMILSSYVTNVSSDLLILLLPVTVIRRLRLRRSHYFGVAFLLAMVFLTIASATLRFVFLWKAFAPVEKKVKSFDESIREVHRIMTWTQIETWLTMLIFALPPLRVYLRRKHKQRSHANMNRQNLPLSLQSCPCSQNTSRSSPSRWPTESGEGGASRAPTRIKDGALFLAGYGFGGRTSSSRRSSGSQKQELE